MSSPTINITTRIKAIGSMLTAKDHLHLVETELRAVNGDMAAALENLKKKLPPAALRKATFAHSLAEWSDDNVQMMKAVAAQPNVTSLRDVALNFDAEKLAALVRSNDVPADVAGATVEEQTKNFATTLHNRLFAAETSAVLQRMVREAEVPI